MDMNVVNALSAIEIEDGIYIVGKNGVTTIEDDNPDRQVKIYSKDGVRVVETTVDDWETTEMKIEHVIK